MSTQGNQDNQNDPDFFWDEEGLNARSEPDRPGRRGLVLLIPLLVFILLAGLFLFALGKGGDPSRLPSTLIGKPAPQFVLPGVSGLSEDGKPVPGFSRQDLAQGQVSVVNVWASWCVPCHQEHPMLKALKEEGKVRLYGLNYKDAAVNARRFISRYGNPFDGLGADRNGRVAIDWGVYGVPETYVVDGDGVIVFKLVGAITPENMKAELLPAILRAHRQNQSPVPQKRAGAAQ